ncbi:hypothetical protein NIES2107_60820 [Nostoc carneum NIES-2107]|nr:hypothetical protein NIES2107_60820 [Nostoc carneum NIES-2107]
MTVFQQISPSALRAYKATRYMNGNPQKMLLEAKRASRATSQFMSRGGARAAAKRMKLLKKSAKETKTLWDTFLKKVPGGTQTQKAAGSGRVMGALYALAISLGIATFMLKLNELVQAANEVRFDRMATDLSKNLSLLQLLKTRIDNTNKRLDINNKDVSRINSQVGELNRNNTKIKENANNALYEVRSGRKILEGKIVEAKKQANDALYETRKGREIVEAKIADIRTRIDNQIVTIKTQLDTLKSQVSNTGTTAITNLKAEIVKVTTTVNEAIKKNESLSNKVDNIPPTIINIQKELAKIKPDEIVGTTIKYVDGKIAEIKDILKKDIQPKIDAQGKEIKDIGGVTVTSYEGVTKSLKDTYSLSFEAGAAKWNEDIRAAQAEILKSTSVTISSNTTTSSAQTAQQLEKLKTEIKADLGQQTKELEKLRTDLDKTKQSLPSPSEINSLKIQTGNLSQKIPQLEKDIKEQKKVNDAALPKLDDISAKLGLIPALTAKTIKPDLPTTGQIEQATGTAICRSLNGGCAGRSLNDAVGNIKNNANNNANSVLDAVNAGLNTADLALLGVINNKLGDQVPGGISGKLDRFSKWLHLDRLLNMMIFATTVHNAFQLSNDIATTLGSALSNILGLIGLKDDTGSNIDIGQIINSTVENLVKGIVGEENYQSINAAWQKANRIYQATTNVLNNLMNVNSVITNALEVIGSYTGKIGNALRIWGVVGEKAYSWMNPQPSFDNKWMTKLQQLQEGANTVAMVAQIPVDAVNAVTELNNSATEFVKAVKQEPDTKDGLDVGEAAKVKTERDAAKIASYVPAFDITDLFDADD